MSANQLMTIDKSTIKIVKLIVSYLSLITVEPIIFMAYTARYATNVITQDMIQRQICQTDYNGTVKQCDNYITYFINNTEIIEGIQSSASDYNLYHACVTTIPALFLVNIIGPWSDLNGRKIIILLPLIGGIISAILFVLLIRFQLNEPFYILLASVPLGLTGHNIIILMGCFSYLGDVTNERNRTFRMAILDGVLTVGIPLGMLLGSELYRLFGYIPVYIASGIFYMLAFIYTTLRISNQSVMINLEQKTPKEMTIVDNFKTCFKKRDGNLRALIIALLVCDILVALPAYGEINVLYLYCRRRYNWGVQSFMYYQTFTIVSASFGMLIVMPVMSRVFNVQDSFMGLLGNIGRLLGSILKIFSFSETLLWAAGSTEAIASITFVINKAMLSKCVPKCEMGKIFALDGIITASVPPFTGIAYTQLYKLTMTSFPEAMFFISVITTLIAAIIFIFISYFTMKKRQCGIMSA